MKTKRVIVRFKNFFYLYTLDKQQFHVGPKVCKLVILCKPKVDIWKLVSNCCYKNCHIKYLRGVIKKFVDCLYKIKTPQDKSMKI